MSWPLVGIGVLHKGFCRWPYVDGREVASLHIHKSYEMVSADRVAEIKEAAEVDLTDREME